MKVTIQLEPLTCPSCIQKIESALKSVDGVDKETVKILFNSSKVKLEFDSNKTSVEVIGNVINKLGYEVKKTTTRPK